MKSSFINLQTVTLPMLSDLLEALLKFLADKQAAIQYKAHDSIVQSLLYEMVLFFKAREQPEQQEPFLTADPLVQSLPFMPPSPRQQATPKPASQQAEVNEIIVKIEMKKFQNLIENRIKHKNNLLQADVKRLYPMNKLAIKGFIPFD